MEYRSFVIETGFKWEGGSPTKRDTWTEIRGDGIDAAVKDGAARVIEKLALYLFELFRIF